MPVAALPVTVVPELARALAGVRPGSAGLPGPGERPGPARPNRPRGPDPAGVRKKRRALVIRGAAHLATLRGRRRPGREGQGGPPRLARPGPGTVQRARRARGQGGRRNGRSAQRRGPWERPSPRQGGGGGPAAGATAVRHRVAGQLVAGPVPGHEPHHQGSGHRDHAGAIGPGHEPREPEERLGRAAAQQAMHQSEDPRGVGRRVDDTPCLRGHPRGQPGPVDARHYDHDEHIGRDGSEAEVESLSLIEKRNNDVGRLRPARDYLEHDVNSQESYCAESHGAVKCLRRDPGAGLHKDAVRSDQPNSHFRG